LIDKWSEALKALTGTQSFQARIEALGGNAAYLGPSDFKAALAQEFQTARQFATALGLQG
jgi:tripartite-type tricarboxylate transporter receptor subunit TctC